VCADTIPDKALPLSFPILRQLSYYLKKPLNIVSFISPPPLAFLPRACSSSFFFFFLVVVGQRRREEEEEEEKKIEEE
jgi:hypothetical protein